MWRRVSAHRYGLRNPLGSDGVHERRILLLPLLFSFLVFLDKFSPYSFFVIVFGFFIVGEYFFASIRFEMVCGTNFLTSALDFADVAHNFLVSATCFFALVSYQVRAVSVQVNVASDFLRRVSH